MKYDGLGQKINVGDKVVRCNDTGFRWCSREKKGKLIVYEVIKETPKCITILEVENDEVPVWAHPHPGINPDLVVVVTNLLED